jgi:hypothetical protein
MMTGYPAALLCFLSVVLGFALRGPMIGLGLAALFALMAWQLTLLGFQKAEASARDVLEKMVKGVEEEIALSGSKPGGALVNNAQGTDVADVREILGQG